MAPAIDILTGTQGLMKGSDEDCLFVNVYTKETPKPGKKLPVLVWIHGGGYAFGSGNKSAHSPEYFMTHDIVFVSMNYRLGAFGKSGIFFNHVTLLEMTRFPRRLNSM